MCPRALGFDLPDAGAYGVGTGFCPQASDLQAQARGAVEAALAEARLSVRGWRRVPVASAMLGTVSRSREPAIWHVFVAAEDEPEAAAFERRLYIGRRLATQRAAEALVGTDAACCLPSLSARTVAYKGMLRTMQLRAYYPDLSHPLVASALALVHSRFSTNTLPRWSLAQPFRYIAHNGEINTLRGNINWMHAREALFADGPFGDDLETLRPIPHADESNSANLDHAVEPLCQAGRSLPPLWSPTKLALPPMADARGFLKHHRALPRTRPVAERERDLREISLLFPAERLQEQAARCMDSGIPFCQAVCPLGNSIPDWNDLMHGDRWRDAYGRLVRTNNFPEFTGRICPAPCESACVLGLVDDPVTIEQIERDIIERAFEEGWATPRVPQDRSGRRVAIVGSGPAGLACADQLNQAGHSVTVFEGDDQIGGLLRCGIPDFKLDKHIVQRRVDLMAAEGITFRLGVEVGETLPAEALTTYDAVVLCTGATEAWRIDAAGKDVIVIGGGDTGSDCVGMARRQGAASVTQFELLPMLDAAELRLRA